MTDSPGTHDAGERPAIVVVAYNRPHSLQRLLSSLSRLRIPEGGPVSLIIGIDDAFAPTVRVAEAFTWSHGPKQILQRPDRLGLRKHILRCGDLSKEYGSVVVLEDDLYVSPDMYRFAEAALRVYRDEEQVAGISLYAYRLDELQRLRFLPLDDGADTFFMQFPSSWGQLWTARQWIDFRTWDMETGPVSETLLPTPAARWNAETSWKRRFLEYLIDTDRYFVFPRHSLTTNCGDAGQHFRSTIIDLTAPLSLGPREWTFATLEDDAVIYDAWFEPLPDTIRLFWPEAIPVDVTIDFRGQKAANRVTTAHLVSSRPSTNPSATFPFLLQPEALNLQLPGEGRFFSLGPSESFGPLGASRLRHLTEALNGEVGGRTAAGLLFDKARRRLLGDRRDWRLGD